MKSENRICHLYALLYSFYFLVFVLLLQLFDLPVHAAEDYYVTESNITGSVLISHILTYTNNDGKNEIDTNEWSFNLSNDGFYGIAPLTDGGDVYALYMFDLNNHGVSSPKISYISVVDWNIDGKNVFHSESPSNNKLLSFSVGSFESPWTNPNNGIVYDNKWSIPLPVFVSQQAFTTYCKNGDKSGLINISGSIDNPDFEDTSYAFTGFTANNKMTATWTGTTERTYLQDQEVEEYVRVNYYFADKEAQDTIKQADAYPDEFATADKTLTIDVSGLKPDDENWFLRYIRITPCYRQAGLGAWGDFYHGVDCKVYFNQDGSIDKIVRDFSQGSGDYSYKHIFTSDKYSTDIPAPELSAISHNGFTLLNNSNNDYYVDIILESNLYGVKMEKNAGTWLPVVDTDWVYNSHYYNFADTSQIAINNDVIYIPNLFSVNPESDLVDDFKKWSLEYSSYSSLPSMSFLKRSTAARTRYVDQFLFKDDSKFSDSEQLKFSHMAESVFYVRYYNKSMIYGPWVRYKFRDGYVAQVIDGTLGGAYIDVGQVDTDDSGNVRVDEKGDPIVSDNVSGRQDYDTGESDFSDGSFSLDLSDVTKFFDYLKKIFESVTGALSSFGSVVAACFGFLPGELINALIFGICVMMFIGIIKAVKG